MHAIRFPNWLCLFLVGGLTLLVIQLWRRPRRHSTKGIPPGSLGLPLIGETLQFMAAIRGGEGFYQFVQARRLRYGKCFKTNIFGETQVFISSTKSAKVILNNETGLFTKRYIRSIAKLVGDESLLCASHHHHKKLRARLLNLLSTNSIVSLIQYLDPLIVHSLRNWERAGTVVVLEETLKITFKAMCKMLIDLENEKEVDALLEQVTHVCKAMLGFPLKFPGTRFYRGLQAREKIMQTLDKLIVERRSSMGSHDDFLQQLLMENDAISSSRHTLKLRDAEIKDNILTMIIAGQDTTASALTWMVKYLSENQKA
ncbi:cytochrome P450 720B2, partial [Carica papaya]|uniref:cytochrome P450 720B2 n=1 Tax=Carica papaya TaxID=3649 RepID=UPI000B8C8286